MINSFYSSLKQGLQSNDVKPASTNAAQPVSSKKQKLSQSTEEALSIQCLDLSEKLGTLGFTEEKQWLIELNDYFINDQYNTDITLTQSQGLASSSQQSELISTFLNKLTSITANSTSEKPSGYFNFYVSSIFKDSQKEIETKQNILTLLKNLLSQLHQSYITVHKPRKCVLIQEFLSLYPAIGTYQSVVSSHKNRSAHQHSLDNSHKNEKDNHAQYNMFVSPAAHQFMLKYFKFDSSLLYATSATTITAATAINSANSSEIASLMNSISTTNLTATVGEKDHSKQNQQHNSNSGQFGLQIPSDATTQAFFDKKIFWCDFAAALERHYSETMDVKRIQVNFNEIITYMKPLIDTNHDNTIDFSEIDAFFTSYNCQNISQLTQAIETLRFKAIPRATQASAAIGVAGISPQLSIELTHIPETFKQFYSSGESVTRMSINPFYERVVIGRKNEKEFGGNDKSSQILTFPFKDSKISRSQLALFKDDSGQYYLENLNLQQPITFLLSPRKLIVKEGSIFQIGRKTSTYTPAVFTVEQLIPPHENFVLGKSILHPKKDLPYIDLAGDLDIAKVLCAMKKASPEQNELPPPTDVVDITKTIKSQSELKQKSAAGPVAFQARFNYKNMNYLCEKKRFTVGKTVLDDIQIDQAENTHIEFEYLDNYGWVVSSTQPETYMRVSESGQQKNSKFKNQLSKIEVQRQTFNELSQQQTAQQSLKYRIFHGLTFAVCDYECTFSFV